MVQFGKGQFGTEGQETEIDKFWGRDSGKGKQEVEIQVQSLQA